VRTYRQGLSVLFCVALLGCEGNNVSPNKSNIPVLEPLSNADFTLATSTNNFGINLFKQLQTGNSSNIFIAPLSVGMALGMVMNGASTSTLDSLLKTMTCNDVDAATVDQGCLDLTNALSAVDNTVTLSLANSVWFNNQFTVKNSFRATIQKYFEGTVTSLDFSNSAASVSAINNWVSNETRGKITHLIDAIHPDDVMFLINTVYFKGSWTNFFDATLTKPGTFYQENAPAIQVSMMTSTKADVGVYHGTGFLLANVPYGNKQFTMTILMPDSLHTVQNLLERLSVDSLSSWLEKTSESQRALTMPKFSLTWSKDLLADLEKMGLVPDGFPNLIEENKPLAITRVIHQSKIEVDEEGSTAAAATGVGVTLIALPSPVPPIAINRPFLFFIREKHSEVILFMGQLYSPSGN
jgi:serine protease inhibitor